MNTWKIIALVALSLSFASHAQACNRCDHHGNACYYQAAPIVHHQQAVVAAPVQNYVPPPALIINNIHPQPNGQYQSPLTAPQGGTQYTLGPVFAAQRADPATLLYQLSQLQKDVNSGANSVSNGVIQTYQLELQLGAQQNQALTQAAAAQQVLDAAGINPSRQQLQQQPQQMTFQLQADGSYRIQQPQVQQQRQQFSFGWGAKSPAVAPPQQPEQPRPQGNSIVSQKCGQCHGLNLSEPKGSLYVDAGAKIDCESLLACLKAVESGKMPKGSTLTEQEKNAVRVELLGLSK